MKKFKGFTLIELLTVIAIIGILASIVIVNVNEARKRGRDARRKSDMDTLRNALEMYYDKNKEYPRVQMPLAAPSYPGDSCATRWCVSAEDFDDGTVGNPGYFTLPNMASERWITGLVKSYDAAGINYEGGYLPTLPLDPINLAGNTAKPKDYNITAADNYFYLYKITLNAQDFKLMAKLEDDTKSMENDGGKHDDLYELFTPNAQSLTNPS